jgi:hypothetical protein
MPIIRSLRIYRCPQRVAPRLGYDRLLVWCMAVGLSVRSVGCCTLSVRLEGCCTTKPLCSIKLVLLSSCHRRCTVKHSSKTYQLIFINYFTSITLPEAMDLSGLLHTALEKWHPVEFLRQKTHRAI